MGHANLSISLEAFVNVGNCVFSLHFVKQGRLQLAMQSYRKALETDSHCVCALYQSTLIYRQLGNTKAEIQALQLLHSVCTVINRQMESILRSHTVSIMTLYTLSTRHPCLVLLLVHYCIRSETFLPAK